VNLDEHPYASKLIALYAKHTIADMEQKPELAESEFGPLDTISKDTEYSATHNLVKELRQLVVSYETDLNAAVDDERVAQCLFCLLDTALFNRKEPFDDRMQILQALLVRMYGANWNDKQRSHFAHWAECARSWSSFFLSYSNRDSQTINNDYESLIEHLLKKPDAKTWQESNLLAEALVRQLEKLNLMDGFYDKRRIAHGDELKKVIDYACKHTFVFLQLVQQETFAASDENWCYLEFTTFFLENERLAKSGGYTDLLTTRFRPVVAMDVNNLPKLVPPDYRDWKAKVLNHRQLRMLTGEVDKFRQVASEIADGIVSFKRELMREVPK
jgi:hypothetical protein